jgi:hypothetical protein
MRALLAVALCTACGPTLMVPGGKLDGPSAPVPGEWASVSGDVTTVQLETRPGDPYSVNIWAAAIGPLLYVHAGANRSTWVEQLEADPLARVRIDGTLYEVRASRVESQEEFDRFCDAYEEKYGTRPRNENVDEAYLFSLVARS